MAEDPYKRSRFENEFLPGVISVIDDLTGTRMGKKRTEELIRTFREYPIDLDSNKNFLSYFNRFLWYASAHVCKMTSYGIKKYLKAQNA